MPRGDLARVLDRLRRRSPHGRSMTPVEASVWESPAKSGSKGDSGGSLQELVAGVQQHSQQLLRSFGVGEKRKPGAAAPSGASAASAASAASKKQAAEPSAKVEKDRVLEGSSRLRVIARSAKEEFADPSQSTLSRLYRMALRRSRIDLSRAAIAQPKLLNALGGVGAGCILIMGIGGVEGHLWLSQTEAVPLLDSLRFSVQYGALNLVPSFTWTTVDPTVVLQSMNPPIGNADRVLYDFSLLHEATHAADVLNPVNDGLQGPAGSPEPSPGALDRASKAAAAAVPTTDAGLFSSVKAALGATTATAGGAGGAAAAAAAAGASAAASGSAVHGPPNTIAEVTDAYRLAHLAALASIRGVVANVVVLTQLLTAYADNRQAEEVRRDLTLNGKEPLLPTVTGREVVVRLCGSQSETTLLALERYGEHLLPVLEGVSDAELKDRILASSQQGRVPCWWLIRSNGYASPRSWEGIGITPEWLMQTSTGKKLLLVEADGTIPAERETQDEDLALDEAVQGFRSFDSFASAKLPPYRLVRTILADTTSLVRIGGEELQTVRDRLLTRGEADIVIDSTLPILDALVQWTRRVKGRAGREAAEKGQGGDGGPAGKPRMVFETSDEAQFETLKAFLDLVCDVELIAPSADHGPDEATGADGEPPGRLPRLIYYPSTATTVTALQNIAMQDRKAMKRICVVFDKAEGLDVVGALEDKTHFHIETICSADIHDVLLRSVRSWLRAGHSPSEIQEELDLRFGYLWPVVVSEERPAGDE